MNFNFFFRISHEKLKQAGGHLYSYHKIHAIVEKVFCIYMIEYIVLCKSNETN